MEVEAAGTVEEVDLLADFNTSPASSQLGLSYELQFEPELEFELGVSEKPELGQPMCQSSNHGARTTVTTPTTSRAKQSIQVSKRVPPRRTVHLKRQWRQPYGASKGPINGSSVIQGIDQGFLLPADCSANIERRQADGSKDRWTAGSRETEEADDDEQMGGGEAGAEEEEKENGIGDETIELLLGKGETGTGTGTLVAQSETAEVLAEPASASAASKQGPLTQSISGPRGIDCVNSIEWRYANELLLEAGPWSQSGIASLQASTASSRRIFDLGELVSANGCLLGPSYHRWPFVLSRIMSHELCASSSSSTSSSLGTLPFSWLNEIELSLLARYYWCWIIVVRVAGSLRQPSQLGLAAKMAPSKMEGEFAYFGELQKQQQQQQRQENGNLSKGTDLGSATFSCHFRRFRLASGEALTAKFAAEWSKFLSATRLAVGQYNSQTGSSLGEGLLAMAGTVELAGQQSSEQVAQMEPHHQSGAWMPGKGIPLCGYGEMRSRARRKSSLESSVNSKEAGDWNLEQSKVATWADVHKFNQRQQPPWRPMVGFAPLAWVKFCLLAQDGSHLALYLPLRANVIDLNHKCFTHRRLDEGIRGPGGGGLLPKKGAGTLGGQAREADRQGCELNANEGEGVCVATSAGHNGRTKEQEQKSGASCGKTPASEWPADGCAGMGACWPKSGPPANMGAAAAANTAPRAQQPKLSCGCHRMGKLNGKRSFIPCEKATALLEAALGTSQGSPTRLAGLTQTGLPPVHIYRADLWSCLRVVVPSTASADDEPKRLLEPNSWILMIDRSCANSDKSDECDAISRPREVRSLAARRALVAQGKPNGAAPLPSPSASPARGCHANSLQQQQQCSKPRGCNQLRSPMQLLLLLFLLPTLLSSLTWPRAQLAASAATVQQQQQQPAEGKLELWRQLVSSALGDVSDDNKAAALERLARKLNKWPDQRQAALFYLDLVARKRDRMMGISGALASSSSGGGDDSSPLSAYGQSDEKETELCQRASLAELVASSQHPVWASSASSFGQPMTLEESERHMGPGRSVEQARGLAELNELNAGTVSASLLAKLNNESKFLAAASLAADVSNLISRLLIHPESEVVRRIASPKFFRYLLESKLRQLSPDLPELHSAGLVFCQAGGPENLTMMFPPEVGSSVSAAAAAAEMRKRRRRQQQQLDKWPEFAPLAILTGGDKRQSSEKSVLSLDLALHLVAGNGRHPNGYFGLLAGGMQPFFAKWLLLNLEQLKPMERRLSLLLNDQWATNNSQQAANSLRASDGRWFSPYLDCGLSNRWLISYSIPFFASDTNQPGDGSVKFRGISFVSLDFGRLKLIDQCAKEQGAAFLANTNHCGRLQRSQCLRLTEFEDIRSGAYVCQCPAGGSVASAERQATELYRDKLASLIIGNSTSALDQLILELDERFGDKSLVAASLLGQQQPTATATTMNGHPNEFRTSIRKNRKTNRYFALGAQLNLDAALDWFTGSESSWPKQICRACQTQQTKPEATTRGPNQTPSSSSSNYKELQNGSYYNDGSIAADCYEFNNPSALFTWIRPLVVTLQSICLLITLTLVGILLRVRKSRIMLVSGWLMLGTMLIGALLLYTSVLVHYFEPTSVTCLLEPWLRELGFSIFYGSILIKLYRILTEFQTRKAHRVCFRDKDQIVYLLAIVLIVVGYMSAWTALMVDGFFFGQQAAAKAASNHKLPSSGGGDDDDQTHLELTNLPLPPSRPSNLGPINDSSSESDTPEETYNNNRDSSNRATGNQRRPASNSASAATAAELVPLELEGHFKQRQHQVHLNLLAGSEAEQESQSSFSLLNYSASGGGLEVGSRLASAVDQLAEFAPEQLKNFARNFNSFADLFSGLVETQAHYDQTSDSLAYSMRCRKLTWDYVTELSEMTLLIFGIYLIYKLRNASSEVYKEKLVLCAAVFIELFASGLTYMIRHFLWNQLSSDQILLLYFGRCQLTVTVNLALVFGPKLWTICKSKPTLFSLSGNRSTGGSMRHRCHISCELHDHHLNDAMRLHQAMLSNAALDIGSINLADMDPDEIQAELKRVYAQLEVLKTKVMRRDNPHISKRRGGRKTGHRKFSLQAFHAKHHLMHHNSSSNSSTNTNQQQQQQQQQHQSDEPSTPYVSCSESAGAQNKLPTVVEQDNLEGLPSEVGEENCAAMVQQAPLADGSLERQPGVQPAHSDKDSHNHPHPNKCRHHQHQHHRHHHHHHNHHHNNNDRRNQHQHQQQAAARKFTKPGGHQHSMVPSAGATAAPDPAPTSSPYYDEDTMISNESPSSGILSPPRRSSLACSQSSIHPEDSSFN